MKPLARAVVETAGMGSAEVVAGVGVLSPLVREHRPVPVLVSATLAALAYGVFMWVLVYRVRWRAVRDTAQPAGGLDREDPGRSYLRGTAVGAPVAILCGLIAVSVGNGGIAGIAVGNGVTLLVLAGLMRRTELARGVELLRYPAFRRSGGFFQPRDFYVG